MEGLGLLVLVWIGWSVLSSVFGRKKSNTVTARSGPLPSTSPVQHPVGSARKVRKQFALEDVELTEEFTRIIDLLEHTDRCIFVTGRAGTGKSTLLRYFRAKTKKNIVVVAPTGIAAINVEGQTIHSFFRLPPRFR